MVVDNSDKNENADVRGAEAVRDKEDIGSSLKYESVGKKIWEYVRGE